MNATAWPNVPLGDLSTSRLGKMLSPAAKAGDVELPYLGNAEVRWGAVELRDLRTMTFSPAEQIEFSLLAGDVLICEGGEVGRSAVVERDLPGIHFQKAIHRVRCGDRLLPRYLYRYMRYAADTGRLDDVSSQATIRHLTGVKLRTLQIPLPPLEEQRRIVGILDAADALRAKRRQALAKLDTLTQSIFVDMFGDPLENQRGFDAKPLIELVDPDRPITYGILKPGDDVADGVPYVRVVDMVDGTIHSSGLRRTTPEISDQYKRSVLRSGDLLMSIRGHVGRLALVPDDAHGSNITQDSARLAIGGAQALYVLECLRTPAIQRWMANFTKGAAVRGINLTDVKKLPVPLPPDGEQAQFATLAASVQMDVDLVRHQLQQLDALFASLQQRAFRGEL